MTLHARLVEQRPTEVHIRRDLRGPAQLGDRLADQRDPLARRRADDAPHLADAFRQSFVVEQAELAHHVGGHIACGHLLRRDGVEQRGAVGRARREDRDDGPLVGRVEFGVDAKEDFWSLLIVVGRKPPDRLGAQFARADEALQHGRQGRVFRLDQRRKRIAADGRRHLAVLDGRAEGAESLLVSEQHREADGRRADPGVAARHEFLAHGGPALRHRDRLSPDEARAYAAEEGQLRGGRIRLAQRLDEQGDGLLLVHATDTPDRERQQRRHLRRGRQPQRPDGVEFRERFGGVPVHQREVVIGRVLGVADQRLEDRPAVGERQALEGAREVEADHRRRIVLGEPGEFLE